ncbi:hypothetical protein Acid345_1598 [Candidatus Koribacter versatilis Ellin345]|uniref:Uncharacterized protein n=1 Tax=Koribacter versatilis (strain Ellin345) TaxID=204669 RepID=Q1IRA0_KORVE|nr:hypothetical protein [Candidatus Koribacter versatilis]ABF40600.1 hypothetical protein Acid345_1598 [Candidatus Koribacter versatilis Ellin345]
MDLYQEEEPKDRQSLVLLIVTVVAVVIGGIVLYFQFDAKSKKPEMGWYNIGTESVELKPSGYHAFSYRNVPPKFRIEVHASEPVSFGFVTPDTYGHYTSTIMQVDFAGLPCGGANAKDADLNCSTDSTKRYLLLTDAREDSVPEPPSKKARLQKASAPVDSTQPDNHIAVKMYDWRCVKYCENLPPSGS